MPSPHPCRRLRCCVPVSSSCAALLLINKSAGPPSTRRATPRRAIGKCPTTCPLDIQPARRDAPSCSRRCSGLCCLPPPRLSLHKRLVGMSRAIWRQLGRPVLRAHLAANLAAERRRDQVAVLRNTRRPTGGVEGKRRGWMPPALHGETCRARFLCTSAAAPQHIRATLMGDRASRRMHSDVAQRCRLRETGCRS